MSITIGVRAEGSKMCQFGRRHSFRYGPLNLHLHEDSEVAFDVEVGFDVKDPIRSAGGIAPVI